MVVGWLACATLMALLWSVTYTVMSLVLWKKLCFSALVTLVWLTCTPLCTSVTLFSLQTFNCWVWGRWNYTAHVLPSLNFMPSLVLAFFLFFPPFSPRSNVENAASPKPLLLPSKSPKMKSNPTLLFYSALSHSSSPFLSSLSLCQTAPPCPTRRNGTIT